MVVAAADEAAVVPPGVGVIEAHEEFKQQIEAGASKVRILGIITMGVTLLLIISYLYQLILPYSSGTRYVQVDLLDPTLAATQILLIVLVGAWFYVGVTNYLFATRMQKRVREIRAGETELEKRVFG